MNYDKALGIAISNVLSDWDDNLTNEQIMEAVLQEDFDKVTFWQPFECLDGDTVYEHIKTLAANIESATTK